MTINANSKILKLEIKITTNDKINNKLKDNLGTDFSLDNINNYFDVIKHLKDCVSAKVFTNVLDQYFRILQSTRCDIPTNIQYEWLELNKVHNYQTKFLPENSDIFNKLA